MNGARWYLMQERPETREEVDYMPFEIKMKDNSNEIIKLFEERDTAGKEAVGLAMEAHVVEACPVGTPDTTSIKNYHGGALKKSITHKVIDDTVFVGTNMKANGKPYPVYVEFGTGVHAEGGKGRQSPWVWRDKNGDYHYTHGIKPTHFMRNALQNPKNIEEYKQKYENQLKKG